MASRRTAQAAVEYLLIDVSNSFTKLAFATRKRIARPFRIATRSLTSETLRRQLRLRNAKTLVVSSVVPDASKAIRAAAGRRKIVWLTAQVPLGVGIDYPAPKTIGADRLANAAAAAALYGSPAIVVDFGTAVTFDILSRKGAYIGGVIAPGLESMTNFLYQRTALLPKLTLREPKRAVGKSTREAMLAGAVFGYRGLVREIIKQIKEQEFAGKKVRVIATGGYAHLIGADMREIEEIHPHLTLEGLRLVGNLNS
jgi:type III pantothenate kinase